MAFPTRVAIERDADGRLTADVDGIRRALPSPPNAAWVRIALREPGPEAREYQVDGTDLTAAQDRDAGLVRAWQDQPLYQVAAWLRDESGYSRWQDVRVLDLATGAVIVRGRAAVESWSGPLPARFRVEADLRRPEAAASLWLVEERGAREGLELSRDARSSRWLRQEPGREDAAGEEVTGGRAFFPEDPRPFAAMLLNLLGRSAMAAVLAFVLVPVLLAAALGRVMRIPDAAPGPPRQGGGDSTRWALRPAQQGIPEKRVGRTTSARWLRRAVLASDLLPALWLLAAAWTTVALYRQLPHVLDAVSYVFQAKLLRAGRFWIEPPRLVDAFKGPFQVVFEGRWFSQYPPGAPLAYALGDLLGAMWLVGPLAGVLLLAATAFAARTLYADDRLGALVVLLGVASPFLLFQAGSFLSHPIAGALVALALALFAQTDRRGYSLRWSAAAGLAVGAAFVTRETSAVVLGGVLFLWLALHERWRSALAFGAGAAPMGVLYLAYNQALTGRLTTLPRALFDTTDRLGFGDGIGFYGRHTLAAGLANIDEQLTVLQFDLLGWPPLFALGLLALPFLLVHPRRPDRRDLLFGAGVVALVAVFVGYFYHGVALGPRYLFEGLPFLLILAARGLQVAGGSVAALLASLPVRRSAAATASRPPAQHVGTNLASFHETEGTCSALQKTKHEVRSALGAAGVGLVLVPLFASTFGFYLPRQVERRAEYLALPYGRKLELAFVQPSPGGARIDPAVPAPALVLVDDWWLYSVVLSPLSCARPDLGTSPDACPRLFALATNRNDEDRLRAAYPGRTVLRAVIEGSALVLRPAA